MPEFWSESTDGRILEVSRNKRGTLDVLVQIDSCSDDMLFAHHVDMIDQGYDMIDFRSRFARFGFNSKVIDEPKVVEDTIQFGLNVYPYHESVAKLDFDWRTMFNPGQDIAKLVAIIPEDKVGKDRLLDDISVGYVRLPKGSLIHEDGTVELALHKRIHNLEPLSKRELYAALTSLDRGKLTQLQKPDYDIEKLIVPKNTGIIGFTSVRINNYSVFIHTDQIENVTHTMAQHVTPHSTGNLFVELIGNGSDDVEIERLKVNFYNNRERQKRIIVPSYSIGEPENYQKTEVSVEKDELVRLCEVQPDDKESVKRFGKILSELSPDRHTLYFSKFPSSRELNHIATNIDYDKIGKIVFKETYNPDGTFSVREFERMKEFSGYGVKVFWDNDDFINKLIFHRSGFVVPEKISSFDTAYTSNSIFAIFGSGNICTLEDQENIRGVIKGVYDFTGGEGWIFTGGGKCVMDYSLQYAREIGLNTGSINILKFGETQSPHVDVFFPHHPEDISVRQGNLVDIASGYLYPGNGGLGTLYEVFEILTKEKLGFSYKPSLVVGDPTATEGEIVAKGADLIKMGIQQGTVDSYVQRCIHTIQDPTKTLQELNNHFHYGNPEIL